ncbi:MAG: hypothetical protein JWL61_4363 [Gemmatimonadetes bacterium]|nr:hypothetical protein [Gemmatimonadota bacterium]
MNSIGVVLLGVPIVLAIALVGGELSWRRVVHRLLGRMAADARFAAPSIGRFHTEQLAQLPRPVQRYFAFALSPAQPIVVAAHAKSQGEFRLRLGGGWHAFTAVQHFSTSPRAFVWDAEINVAPLVNVKVADRYLHGEGGINARAVSVVPVVNEHGTPELAAGELLRYLAEAVMMPTALLPSSGVQWSPVDDDSARVTMTDQGTTVSAVFHFGPRGEIDRVSALRYRGVGETAVLTPWVGRFGDYRSAQGMMVPMYAEVAWIVGGGVMSYFRGRTTNIAFELAA